MFPSLSPLSDTSTAGLEVKVPPPPNFRPPAANIHAVTLETQPYLRQKGVTAAHEAGLRFEEKVQRKLLEAYPDQYKPNPKVSWFDNSGFRTCYPDGLLLKADRTVIIEIKVRHMPEAWWQLRELYSKVLSGYRGLPLQVIEIVRTYDPAMPFPEPILLLSELCAYTKDATLLSSFGVLPWKL